MIDEQAPILEPNTVRELLGRKALCDTFGPVVVVAEDSSAVPITQLELGAEPCVMIGVDVKAHDLAAIGASVDDAVRTVFGTPQASVSAALLLRQGSRPEGTSGTVEQRLINESATYSALQSGDEFSRWLARYKATKPPTTPPPRSSPAEAAIVVETLPNTLRITLSRPHHGNAVNRQLRDELCDALRTAINEPTWQVEIAGSGAHFCTGGDLDEFGTFPSPAEAHLVRLQRSPARLLATLAPRLRVDMHGRSAGSGVEWAAFAPLIRAHSNATFLLPELSLGLVPGAGGTVSIADRIGAPRTMAMLLSGRAIDAQLALAWGLIDEIAPEPPA